MVMVPNFLMGSNIRSDFMQGADGITNALGQWQQRQLNDRKLAEDARQFDAKNLLGQRAQDRADELAPLQMDHIRAQIEHQRAQGANEAQLLPLKMAYQRAQTDMANAHAGYYRAAAGAKTPVQNDGPVPGMRPDGSVYDINGVRGGGDVPGGPGSDTISPEVAVQNRVLGSGAFVDPTATKEHADYGAYGLRTTEVPGVVTSPSGRSDPYATQTYQRQRAIDSSPEADKTRYQTVMRERAIREATFGKPPPNHSWTADGKAVRISQPPETASDRQSKVIAEQGLYNLDLAEKALVGVIGNKEKGIKDVPPKLGTFEQLAGDSYKIPGVGQVGQWGDAGIAFRQAKRAIMDLNFALSGKSVSNAEREAFLELYMPKATDSRKAQADKLQSARVFFDTVKKARNSGANDDEVSALYRAALHKAQGGSDGNSPGGAPPASGGDGWTTLPGGVRIREKR